MQGVEWAVRSVHWYLHRYLTPLPLLLAPLSPNVGEPKRVDNRRRGEPKRNERRLASISLPSGWRDRAFMNDVMTRLQVAGAQDAGAGRWLLDDHPAAHAGASLRLGIGDRRPQPGLAGDR